MALRQLLAAAAAGLLGFAVSSSTAHAGEAQAFNAQDLFLACVAGYVGASFEGQPVPTYDASLQLAAGALEKSGAVCPVHEEVALALRDPSSNAYRWLLMVTREFIGAVTRGEKLPQVLKGRRPF